MEVPLDLKKDSSGKITIERQRFLFLGGLFLFLFSFLNPQIFVGSEFLRHKREKLNSNNLLVLEPVSFKQQEKKNPDQVSTGLWDRGPLKILKA